jgi:DNA polymerase-1
MSINPKKNVFIIDGTAFLYRAYYGLRPLHTLQGVAVHAVYGFCRMIKKLIDDHSIQYIVLVWDSKGKTHRHGLYEEYKATRQAPPSDLFTQKDMIEEFANIVGIQQIAQSGVEADDIIYSIVKQLSAKKFHAVMVTSDKDMGQALNEYAIQYDPIKDLFIDTNKFLALHGFLPEKLTFFYALVGDVSDNIPGVKGIGKKTAFELVIQFNSLEDLYNNLDKLKPRTKALLLENKKNAFLSYQLFSLHNCDIEFNPEDYAFDIQQYERAIPFFKDLNFKSLIQNIQGKEKSSKESAESTDHKITYWKAKDFECVKSIEQLKSLCDLIKKTGFCSVDTETKGGRHPMQTEIVGMSFACDETKAFYIPCKSSYNPDCLPKNDILDAIKPILEDQSIFKYMHNAKYDIGVFAVQKIRVKNVQYDTMIMARIEMSNWDKVGLKPLSELHFNESMLSFDEVLIHANVRSFEAVPLSLAILYGASDALQTFRLKNILENRLHEEKLYNYYIAIEHPTMLILCLMEEEGMFFDTAVLDKLRIEIEEELHKLEKEIALLVDKSPGEINLNSPKQIETLLFVELKLPPKKKKQTGYSTDSEVLVALSELHPVPGFILKHRELSKLKHTYIDGLPDYINKRTGKIHTTFNQVNVATGRLSSAEPNMQNIPASGTGLAIREAFKPPRDFLFVAADYSQIELRILAHLAQEKRLIDAFLKGIDIHAQTAGALFDVDPSEVSHDQRQLGKRVNFGILYGQTPFGLSRELGIHSAEAKKYIEKYFAQYPAVRKWMDQVIESAQEKGYVETFWGRRRYVPHIREKNKNLFHEGCRVAINTVAQGTAAEIVKKGMIQVHGAFLAHEQCKGAKLVLQIHDELVAIAPQEKVDFVAQIMQQELESVVTDWAIPFIVGVKKGKNWKEVTK